jgi:hypothetical protein
MQETKKQNSLPLDIFWLEGKDSGRRSHVVWWKKVYGRAQGKKARHVLLYKKRGFIAERNIP